MLPDDDHLQADINEMIDAWCPDDRHTDLHSEDHTSDRCSDPVTNLLMRDGKHD